MRLSIAPYICPFCLKNISLVRDGLPSETQKLNTDDSCQSWSGSGNIGFQFSVHISRHLLAVAILSIEYLDGASLAVIASGSSDSQQSSTHVNCRGSEVSLTSTVSLRAEIHQEFGSETVRGVESENRAASERIRSPTLEALRKGILMSFVESKMDGQQFLPASCLEKLITPSNIRGNLSAAEDDPSIGDIVDFVFNKARKFFAILVSIGVQPSHALYTLRMYGVTDENLPISRETADDHCEKADSERSCRHHPALNVFHRSPWDYVTLSTFYYQQWKFLAPVFGQGKEDTLEVKRILPFVEFGDERSSGAFSEIYKIKIHPDHLSTVDQSEKQNHILALKMIRDEQTGAEEFAAWRAFDRHMKAITPLSNLRSTEIVTPVATFTRGDWRYMLLPWADGGNLRQFWTETDIPLLSGSVVLEVLRQLAGLSNALRVLHQQSWRHGDVKPDNILRFKNQSMIGNLRLGDLGLAKKHPSGTQERNTATQTRYGTIRYEPPEVVTDMETPRSRRYDIWSMGCVIFEFVVWLLHGPNGLRDFGKQLRGNDGFPGAFYAMTGESRSEGKVKIHDTVKTWLEHLRGHPDWSENTALGDLIMTVSSQLLVVDVERRGTARSLAELLKRICAPADSDASYLFPPSARKRRKRVDPPAAPDIDTETHLLLSVPQVTVLDAMANEYRGLRDEDEYSGDRTSAYWKFIVDNDFAFEFLNSIEEPKQSMDAENFVLCAKCADLEIFTAGKVCSYSVSYLEKQAKSRACDLCGLFYKTCLASGLTFLPEIHFFKEGSTLKFHADGAPVLSIVAGLGTIPKIVRGFIIKAAKSDSTPTSDFQLGWAILPEQKSSVSLKLMRHWLRNCDKNHECMPVKPQNPLRLPSRLLAIEGDTVRLRQAIDLQPSDLYLALSYLWEPESRGVVATTSTIAELEAGVPTRTLAPLFQMAISIARDLNFQYLWIDALCIIQDDPAAWVELQKDSETIFRGSYCTLVACSGLENSFLNPRPRRDAIKVKEVDGVPISVCELIDNFQTDVDNSRLSKRGWAFQERALSRRTIFFTRTQLKSALPPFGVAQPLLVQGRLTVLGFSPGPAILGDPDFPKYSVRRLGKIRTYELLYEHYSRLLFSRLQDRPLGIASLEQKLLRDFKTRGAYGCFEIYLARSLLWRRSRNETTLAKIYFDPGLPKIPSWSWMGYAGGINYFDLPFGSIDWENVGWSFNADNVTQDDKPPTLEARGFRFPWNADDQEGVTAIYDRPELLDIFANRVKCVVMGRSRVGDPQKPQAHYLLLVSEIEERRVWERVGVGFVERKSTIFEDEPVSLQIR
ncbi:hypothetical protein RRF57_005990 [Xylaria bambusicola]|uniref:Protein kinase domain-containing protein n=1 Tax=Xylaria bambusicola TaxID=326684 RepID=A0AAN7YY81_9PEZI